MSKVVITRNENVSLNVFVVYVLVKSGSINTKLTPKLAHDTVFRCENASFL